MLPAELRIYSRFSVKAHPDFDFWRTAYSHGWCDLAPFEFDLKRRTLTRVFALEGNVLVSSLLRGTSGGVNVNVKSRIPLNTDQKNGLKAQIRLCLRMDENFRPFHASARKYAQYRWIATSRSGRLLRAPTVFEDAIKMICTTNCTWALTRVMVSNLVQLTGKRLGEGLFAFPEPSAVASLTERELRTHVKSGYRSPYLLELSRRVAEGTLDIESWRDSGLPTDALLKEMRTVKGIGLYAGENLLRLVGRYERLGLDSWVRGQFSQLHARGQKVKDATIERYYEPFGSWRGLFFWLEMTRDWHDDKFRR
jgi:3-methyladenine DNA glycosylase/8-oxoguanine DNA glycosylase